jgi:hypothetical protein
MPTVNTAAPSTAPGGVKSAAKPSARRRAGSTARARTSAKSKAARAKAARTRATSQTRSAGRPADTAARYRSARSTGAIGDYAERAVLIQVGAALTARDRVLASVNDTLSSYSSTAKAQAQLRRFERRGATARNRLERQVRKARVRVERRLRQRRRNIQKTVSDLEERRETVAKNGTELANRVPELANRVQERILNLV